MAMTEPSEQMRAAAAERSRLRRRGSIVPANVRVLANEYSRLMQAKREATTAPPCSIAACSYPAIARGWCRSHYRRWQTKGDPLAPVRERHGPACSVKGCARPHVARGWCGLHYDRHRRSGSTHLVGPPKATSCLVDGCPRSVTRRDYCGRHYRKLLKYGDPLAGRFVAGEMGQGSIDSSGYRRLYRPDHPNSDRSGAVHEHVLVMAEILGRPLRRGESVHHRNGIRADNNRSNLELWTRAQPPGQRVCDLVSWAVDFLAVYDVAAIIPVPGAMSSRVSAEEAPWSSRKSWRTSDGYVAVYWPSHPNAGASGAVFEHTCVMSLIIDRPLRKGETVHHKNGVRDDNAPANLELWSSSHHSGCRVSDLIAYASSILQQYGDAALVGGDAT